jgi:hypothetical protein
MIYDCKNSVMREGLKMELLWEPRTEAMSKVSKVENEPEMSEFESAFLCGLIKTNKPKKSLK